MLRLKVKEVAEEKGFSQGKLARAADIATNTPRAIYRDPCREISTFTINKLAKALEVPVATLTDEECKSEYAL
jgi:DNA-binding Xre family transcriptional regulator